MLSSLLSQNPGDPLRVPPSGTPITLQPGRHYDYIPRVLQISHDRSSATPKAAKQTSNPPAPTEQIRIPDPQKIMCQRRTHHHLPSRPHAQTRPSQPCPFRYRAAACCMNILGTVQTISAKRPRRYSARAISTKTFPGYRPPAPSDKIRKEARVRIFWTGECERTGDEGC